MIGYLIIGALAGFVASKIYKKEGSGCLKHKNDQRAEHIGLQGKPEEGDHRSFYENNDENQPFGSVNFLPHGHLLCIYVHADRL